MCQYSKEPVAFLNEIVVLYSTSSYLIAANVTCFGLARFVLISITQNGLEGSNCCKSTFFCNFFCDVKTIQLYFCQILCLGMVHLPSYLQKVTKKYMKIYYYFFLRQLTKSYQKVCKSLLFTELLTKSDKKFRKN